MNIIEIIYFTRAMMMFVVPPPPPFLQIQSKNLDAEQLVFQNLH